MADETGRQGISAEALEGIVPEDDLAPPVGLQELDQMVGMAHVAQKVREIINTISRAREDNTSLPNMHMCFTGNPGTGKTTVARVIGTALKEAGVLRGGIFRECRGHDLIAKYVGHTAPRTKAICESAYGSVLFIDEAYSITGDEFSSNSFGREAVETLITEMENHRDEFIIIVAGYPAEMKRFLESNPGMRTRIPYTIEFPNYTREELYDIFLNMSKRFQYGEGFLDQVRASLSGLSDQVMNDKTFGNGRFIRNLFERVWSKASMRCPGVKSAELVLEREDFEAAAAEFDELHPKRDGIVRKVGYQ